MFNVPHWSNVRNVFASFSIFQKFNISIFLTTKKKHHRKNRPFEMDVDGHTYHCCNAHIQSVRCNILVIYFMRCVWCVSIMPRPLQPTQTSDKQQLKSIKSPLRQHNRFGLLYGVVCREKSWLLRKYVRQTVTM